MSDKPGRPRSRPYTTAGIRRLACSACGQRPAVAVFSMCSDNNWQRPICRKCDLEINACGLRMLGYSMEERNRLMIAYRKRCEEADA